MAKVLEEGADLSGYVELRCSADGALYGSRMLEVKREKDGKQIKLALEVADHPPKPPQEEENSKFGGLVQAVHEKGGPCHPKGGIEEC